jgi:hypothetical protein
MAISQSDWAFCSEIAQTVMAGTAEQAAVLILIKNMNHGLLEAHSKAAQQE